MEYFGQSVMEYFGQSEMELGSDQIKIIACHLPKESISGRYIGLDIYSVSGLCFGPNVDIT